MKTKISQLFFGLWVLAILALPQGVHPQIISLVPNQVPNGIEAASGDQFHQLFHIQLGPSAVAQSRAFTITLPSELTYVANSATATSNSTTLSAFFTGAPATDQLAFGLTGTASIRSVTVEFDVTTPTLFTGIAQGEAVNTVYTFDFALGTNQSTNTVEVFKHQNKRLTIVSFSAPESVHGDTTRGAVCISSWNSRAPCPI